MIQIDDNKKCCGCTACFNICPVSAIKMIPDEEGFLYPNVLTGKCIECGACERVCPVLNKSVKSKEPNAYIIRNKQEDVVEDSTSGGAFSAFATYIIDLGGVVYGAGYNEKMHVTCKMASRVEDIIEMRGSKFVQSDLKDVFRKIKDQLAKNEHVLFTGTPCQVEGLISYLGKKPKNLYCIDFVCRGVPSPLLWDNYVTYMQGKYHAKLVSAKFKNKTYGYHASTMKLTFENGKVWYGSGRVDPMMKAFVNELASRPSCGSCAFKSLGRVSDITMFDCYNYSKVIKQHDDDKGYTSLLVHTSAGAELLAVVNDKLIVNNVDTATLVEENGIMVCNSAKPNKMRDEFYALVKESSIDRAINHILPISYKDKMIEYSKGFLFKTGLIRIAKKMKKEEVLINE